MNKISQFDFEPLSWDEGNYRISTDPELMNVDFIHGELSRSYWAEGIPRSLVEKSIRYSLCFGAYEIATGKQVGFGRIVSDFSTFSYLADVFVIAEHRGRGVARHMVRCTLAHPELQGLRRRTLGTRDAHTLYEKFGYRRIAKPENWLEIRVMDAYQSKPGAQDL